VLLLFFCLLLLDRAGGSVGAGGGGGGAVDEESGSGLADTSALSEKTGEPGGERTGSMRDFCGVIGGVRGAGALTRLLLLREEEEDDEEEEEEEDDDDEDEDDAAAGFGAPGSISISFPFFSSLLSFVCSSSSSSSTFAFFLGVRLVGVFVLRGVVVVFFFVGVLVLLLPPSSSFSSSLSSSVIPLSFGVRFLSFSFSSMSTPCKISATNNEQTTQRRNK
jgi:hypothetical protein